MKRFLSLHLVRLFAVRLFAVLLLVDMASVLHAQTRYFVTDLGSFGGTQGFGYAVNLEGQVAGASLTSGDNGFLAYRTAPNHPIQRSTPRMR